MPEQPPLDGPEPRRARLGDGGAHALGATAERATRSHGPSGGSPSWYGPAAIMTTPSPRDSA